MGLLLHLLYFLLCTSLPVNTGIIAKLRIAVRGQFRLIIIEIWFFTLQQSKTWSGSCAQSRKAREEAIKHVGNILL